MLQFNTTCPVDFSKINCASSETNSFPNFGWTYQSITCGSTSFLKTKSEIFLVWPETNSSISKNSPVYRVNSQYLSYLNGTPAGILGQNIEVKIKLANPISKDIHQNFFCSFTNGIANYSISSIGDKEDELSCIVPATYGFDVNSGNSVHLIYSFMEQTFKINKSPLYVVAFSISNLTQL
jgi:hypothetical protein